MTWRTRARAQASDGLTKRDRSWQEYAAWHLGLTKGPPEETKARYTFVYGDFRRLHRIGLIACHYCAAEWRHKEIELAAHELLQSLDRKSGASRRGRAARLGPPREASELATGRRFDVIDIDGPDGYRSLADLREAGLLPER